jgi:peroxiredoxin
MWLLLPWLAWAAAPEMMLRDLDGGNHRVGEYIGHDRWTVVAVWSVDCPICQREIHHMAFFHDEHAKKEATVLGVSIDGFADRARIKRFIDEHALNFPNLIGTRQDIARFGGGPFKGTPTYLFFSPNGQLVAHRLGAITQDEAERIIGQFSAGGSPALRGER